MIQKEQIAHDLTILFLQKSNVIEPKSLINPQNLPAAYVAVYKKYFVEILKQL